MFGLLDPQNSRQQKLKAFLTLLQVVTFKDLQKLVQSQAEQIASRSNLGLDAKLQGLPLWIFDEEQHRLQDIKTKSNCCFWHVIGLPQKDGHDMPLLPYRYL
jgi:hypothetical protein